LDLKIESADRDPISGIRDFASDRQIAMGTFKNGALLSHATMNFLILN
jgi:hypothetical protein